MDSAAFDDDADMVDLEDYMVTRTVGKYSASSSVVTNASQVVTCSSPPWRRLLSTLLE